MSYGRKRTKLLVAVVIIVCMVVALGVVLYGPVYSRYRKAIADCVEWGNSYALNAQHLDRLLADDQGLVSRARVESEGESNVDRPSPQTVDVASAVLSKVADRRNRDKADQGGPIDCNSTHFKLRSSSVVGSYQTRSGRMQRDIAHLDSAFEPLRNALFDHDEDASNSAKQRLATVLPGVQSLYDDSASSASEATRTALADALLAAQNDLRQERRYSVFTAAERRLYAAADAVVGSSNAGRKIDCARQRCVALTFDDGPDPVNSPQIVKTLRGTGTQATFFLMGQKAQGAQGPLAKQLGSQGFAVGSHTWSHEDLPRIMADHHEVQQLDDASKAIASASGRTVNLIRPPHGAVDEPSRRYIADHLGAAIAVYGVDSYDWASGATAKSVERKVLAQVGPGSIILMHDIQPHTVQAVPRIIASLKAQGYRFVTIPELTGQYPRAGAVYYSRTNILQM